MCRLAAEDGCEAMIATPHQRRGEWWNSDREQLAALADQLQDEVGPGFRVYLGGEIHVDSELLPEVEQLPAGGGILPLAGSRYLLIEFDSNGTASEAIHLVHELVVTGWRPIVAHPEFIPWLAPTPRSGGAPGRPRRPYPGDRDERHRRLRPPAPRPTPGSCSRPGSSTSWPATPTTPAAARPACGGPTTWSPAAGASRRRAASPPTIRGPWSRTARCRKPYETASPALPAARPRPRPGRPRSVLPGPAARRPARLRPQGVRDRGARAAPGLLRHARRAPTARRLPVAPRPGAGRRRPTPRASARPSSGWSRSRTGSRATARGSCPPELRAALEARLAARLPAATLAGAPAFRSTQAKKKPVPAASPAPAKGGAPAGAPVASAPLASAPASRAAAGAGSQLHASRRPRRP